MTLLLYYFSLTTPALSLTWPQKCECYFTAVAALQVFVFLSALVGQTSAWQVERDLPWCTHCPDRGWREMWGNFFYNVLFVSKSPQYTLKPPISPGAACNLSPSGNNSTALSGRRTQLLHWGRITHLQQKFASRLVGVFTWKSEPISTWLLAHFTSHSRTIVSVKYDPGGDWEELVVCVGVYVWRGPQTEPQDGISLLLLPAAALRSKKCYSPEHRRCGFKTLRPVTSPLSLSFS